MEKELDKAMTKTGTPTGETAGQEPNAAAQKLEGDARAAAPDNKDTGKGDLSVALRKVREQNRELRRSLAERMAEKSGTTTEGGNLPNFDDFNVTEEMALDIAAGKTDAFNDAMRNSLRMAAEFGRVQATGAAGAMRTEGEVLEMLGEYEIFRDEANPSVSRHALIVASTLVDSLPANAGKEQIRSVIESTVKEFSAYKMALGDDRPDAARLSAGPAGGGGDASTAHLAARPQSAGSMAKASELFQSAVAKGAALMGRR